MLRRMSPNLACAALLAIAVGCGSQGAKPASLARASQPTAAETKDSPQQLLRYHVGDEIDVSWRVTQQMQQSQSGSEPTTTQQVVTGRLSMTADAVREDGSISDFSAEFGELTMNRPDLSDELASATQALVGVKFKFRGGTVELGDENVSPVVPVVLQMVSEYVNKLGPEELYTAHPIRVGATFSGDRFARLHADVFKQGLEAGSGNKASLEMTHTDGELLFAVEELGSDRASLSLSGKPVYALGGTANGQPMTGTFALETSGTIIVDTVSHRMIEQTYATTMIVALTVGDGPNATVISSRTQARGEYTYSYP
jgi:hypothetical protein